MKRCIFLLAMVAGCGFKLAGAWNGTGETGERLFFDIALDFKDVKKPMAVFQYKGAESFRLPVCGFKQVENHVEFQIDADGHAPTCEAAVKPLRFVGDFGADVLAGHVLDADGRRIGTFRAFRKPE